MQGSKCLIEVSTRALEQNLAALTRVANRFAPPNAEAAVLAVIKADAYGHGAALCAPVLARAGAPWLGVTDAVEGALVREALHAAGIAAEAQPRVLIMCGLERTDVPLLRQHRLTPVVWSAEQLAWLAAPASGAAQPIAVHLEVDTGMARQGVVPGEPLNRLLAEFALRPGVQLEGVLTHFASSEVVGSPQTERQRQRFAQALDQIAAAGNFRLRFLHAGNSSTLDDGGLLPWLRDRASGAGAQLLARAGLGLFGDCLPLQGGLSQLCGSLTPAVRWSTRVLALQTLEAGDTVGYNGTFRAPQPMTLALIAAGYADGLRRELSSTNELRGGHVGIRGQLAPIVGRVSMNLTSVDVSGIQGVSVGDRATLLGDGVAVEEHARLAGTIPYEILCGMRGHRVLVP